MHYLYLKWISWILAIPVYVELHDLSGAIALLSSSGLTYLGLQFGKQYGKFRQRRRELEAEALLWRIQGHETKQRFFPDYTPEELNVIRRIESKNQRATILFLRPFAIDHKIIVNTHKATFHAAYFLPGYLWLASNEKSIEELLLRATPSNVDLIGIGNRIELIGPAKLLPNNADWRKIFLTLLPSVQAIVSIPSLHPSTLWELEQIAESGQRARTLMIFIALHFDSHAEPHFHLHALRETLASIGWHLPQALSAGSLVLFDSNGFASEVLTSPNFRHRPLRRALNWAMRPQPGGQFSEH